MTTEVGLLEVHPTGDLDFCRELFKERLSDLEELLFLILIDPRMLWMGIRESF
jgi:hypothetical protein